MKKLTSIRLCEFVIEWGIFVVIAGAPAAFGAVERWAYRSIQAGALIVFTAWLLQKHLTASRPAAPRNSWPHRGPLHLFLAAFVLTAAIQITPLPAALVGSLSPSAHAYHLLRQPAAAFQTLSLSPGLTAEGLLKTLAYAALFLVLSNYRPTGKPKGLFLTRLALVMVAAAFALSVTGIIQLRACPRQIYGLREVSGTVPFGPFVNRNHFAAYAAMTLPLAFAALLSLLSAGSPDPACFGARQNEGIGARFVLLTFMIIAILAALLLTASRGGLAAAGGALAALFLLLRKRLPFGNKRILAYLAVLAVCLFSIVSYLAYRPLTRGFTRVAPRYRVMLWRDSRDIFRRYPLFGTGLGTFEYIHSRYSGAFSRYQEAHPPERRRRAEHAENEYLQILAETGLAGFFSLAAAAVCYLQLIINWKKKTEGGGGATGPAGNKRFLIRPEWLIFAGAAAVTAALIQAGVDFIFRVPANAATLAIISGMSLSAPRERKKRNQGAAGRII